VAEPDDSTIGLVGQTLGEFFVRRLLGRGGMGEVYEADQTALQRRVALKVLREELVKDPAYLHRFQAEARTIARIQHPNIVSVITIGERDAVHYMAMEFVDGRNLRDHIARQGALEEKEAVAILKKTAAALQRAHEEGVVHRDVKPENILITRRTPHRPSEVKVADFGLARRMTGEVSVTQSGMTMGTPLYMSPEQIRGETVDPRSDVYSLGVTAYHMLAGEPPYTGETPMAVAVRHLQGNATPLGKIRPDVSPGLCQLVDRMMAVRVDERVQSAAEALKELNRWRPGATVPVMEAMEFSLPPPAIGGSQGPEKAKLAQTISHQIAKVRDVVGDERRTHWLAPSSLAVALVVGAAAAWAFREHDPFAASAESSIPYPERFRAAGLEIDPTDPEVHFHEANAQPAAAREAALWGVLEAHQSSDPDEIKATLNAAVELYRLYRDRDDEHLVEEIVQWLGATNRLPEQKAHAKLFKAFLHVRRGEFERAKKSFGELLEGTKSAEPNEFDAARVEALAEEFHACLHRMGGQAGDSKKLIADFWRRFTPLPPTRLPKGKG
jgi:tRNA A-37 threonylcarbamoyl transferase component Bud32